MKKIIILCITISALISNHHIFGMLRKLPTKKIILPRKYSTKTAEFNYTAIILDLHEKNYKLKEENFYLRQQLAFLQTTQGISEMPKPIALNLPDRDFPQNNMNKD